LHGIFTIKKWIKKPGNINFFNSFEQLKILEL